MGNGREAEKEFTERPQQGKLKKAERKRQRELLSNVCERDESEGEKGKEKQEDPGEARGRGSKQV